MLTLQDIMTSDVFTVSPDLPLTDLLELFSSRHIGGAPVVTGGNVVGVVSASDLLSFAATLTARQDESVGGETAEGWENASETEIFDTEEPSSRYFTHLWEESPETLDVEWEVAADGRNALHEYTAVDVMSRDVSRCHRVPMLQPQPRS